MRRSTWPPATPRRTPSLASFCRKTRIFLYSGSRPERSAVRRPPQSGREVELITCRALKALIYLPLTYSRPHGRAYSLSAFRPQLSQLQSGGAGRLARATTVSGQKLGETFRRRQGIRRHFYFTLQAAGPC